jgi:uncharacterized protein (TIGR03085 family)
VVTYLAAAERAALCDLALELGPDAATLCEGWDVGDLVAHLVLRDGSLAAVGIVVPPLAGLTDRGMARLREQHDFAGLVERLRGGPPLLSLFRLPPLDRLLNAMEYFVHHEDLRRAQPGWAPRDLPPAVQDALWRGVRHSGRALVRHAEVGVVVRRPDSAEAVTLRRGPRPVTIEGPPAEVALFVHGRTGQARVTLHGDQTDIDRLRGTSLGV